GCVSIITSADRPLPPTTSSTTTTLLPFATWPPGSIRPIPKPDPESDDEFQCDLWFFFVSRKLSLSYEPTNAFIQICISLTDISIGGFQLILPPGRYRYVRRLSPNRASNF